MNLKEIVKEVIAELLFGSVVCESKDVSVNKNESSSAYDSLVGKYVICRAHKSGVNAGFVESVGNNFVVLTNARRLWYFRPAVKSSSWYEGVSIHGVSDNSKLSAVTTKILINEEFMLIECSEDAKNSILEKKEYVS